MLVTQEKAQQGMYVHDSNTITAVFAHFSNKTLPFEAEFETDPLSIEPLSFSQIQESEAYYQ